VAWPGPKIPEVQVVFLLLFEKQIPPVPQNLAIGQRFRLREGILRHPELESEFGVAATVASVGAECVEVDVEFPPSSETFRTDISWEDARRILTTEKEVLKLQHCVCARIFCADDCGIVLWNSNFNTDPRVLS